MNGFILIMIFMFFAGFKIAEPNQYYEDYCSVRKSNAIKGIFVMLIFLSHGMDYFTLGPADQWVRHMSEYLKQHIVVPFFFYSGFGIVESIKKRGLDYVKAIPVRRILKTVIFADISVLAFAILFVSLGIKVSVKQFLLSLVFWDHIGNNTWYFFVILCLYFFTYLSFRVFSRNHFLAFFIISLLSLGMFYFLIEYKEIFWYNTFFAYHFGMFYSLVRRHIESVVMKNDLLYVFALLVAFVSYLQFRSMGSFYYFNISGCLMMMLIVGISMKVSLDNSFLQFLGTHILGFYTLHRIPMILICSYDLPVVTQYIISFLCTVILVLIHDLITGYIERKVFA